MLKLEVILVHVSLMLISQVFLIAGYYNHDCRVQVVLVTFPLSVFLDPMHT